MALIIPGHRARQGQALTAYLEGGSDVDELRLMQLQGMAEAVNGHPHFYGARVRLTPTGGIITANTVGNPIPLVPALYVALGGLGLFTIMKIGEGVKEGVSGWFGGGSSEGEGVGDSTASAWTWMIAGPIGWIYNSFWPRDNPPSNTATAASEMQQGPTVKPADPPAKPPTPPVERQNGENVPTLWEWIKSAWS